MGYWKFKLNVPYTVVRSLKTWQKIVDSAEESWRRPAQFTCVHKSCEKCDWQREFPPFGCNVKNVKKCTCDKYRLLYCVYMFIYSTYALFPCWGVHEFWSPVAQCVFTTFLSVTKYFTLLFMEECATGKMQMQPEKKKSILYELSWALSTKWFIVNIHILTETPNQEPFVDMLHHL